MKPVQADEIRFGEASLVVDRKLFSALGETRYRLELQPAGIIFEVDRLRRSSHELWGELSVMVNGSFPTAKTIDGVLSIGDQNFSSVQARSTRAKHIGERSGASSLDWYGFLEEFAVKVIAAERKGQPATVLSESLPESDNLESLTVNGFPLPAHLPAVLFGDGSSGKSYLSMWIAGSLASQDVPVLYADWEFAVGEHRKRLGRLFNPMPKDVYYVRCDKPLREEVERLHRIVRDKGIRYVICDSIGFAVEGPAENQEGASAYFRYLRQLEVGSLNISHIPKQQDEGKDPSIFGSIYFRNGARSVWFIRRTEDNAPGEFRVGLYHKKNNLGDLLAARGYKFSFAGDRTRVEAIQVTEDDELSTGLPLLDRIRKALEGHASDPQTAKALSEELSVPIQAVRGVVARHQGHFLRIGNKVALKAKEAAGVDF